MSCNRPDRDRGNPSGLLRLSVEIFWIATSRIFWLPPKTPDSPQSPKLVGGREGERERAVVLYFYLGFPHPKTPLSQVPKLFQRTEPISVNN
ncbi:hypothetical protein E2C01_009182 [Portunus trituberculatus]|uniref:Uncharacterized protein n=1 Tax=Portunus trituberculatus TaxID=210409 RepID=A0A5B7D3Y5_PORTR|nr:hypothetical protein [Portunus trituberculatus]